MNLVFDVKTQKLTEVEPTPEQIEQAEKDRLAAEEEQAKPKAPTSEERLSAIEDTLSALLGL